MVLEEVVLEEAFDDWYTDLEVARGAFAFHQGNCCFHILDFVVVVVAESDAAKKDAVVDNDALMLSNSSLFSLLN